MALGMERAVLHTAQFRLEHIENRRGRLTRSFYSSAPDAHSGDLDNFFSRYTRLGPMLERLVICLEAGKNGAS